MEKLGNKVECDSSIMNTIIFLSLEIYLAKRKEVQYNINENTKTVSRKAAAMRLF